MVEVLAAGPKAVTRRDAAMRQFTASSRRGGRRPRWSCRESPRWAIAGGIYELIYSEILHGADAPLPCRLPELVFWITLPFLGADGAAAERERVRRAKLRFLSAGRSAPLPATAGLRIGRGW